LNQFLCFSDEKLFTIELCWFENWNLVSTQRNLSSRPREKCFLCLFLLSDQSEHKKYRNNLWDNIFKAMLHRELWVSSRSSPCRLFHSANFETREFCKNHKLPIRLFHNSIDISWPKLVGWHWSIWNLAQLSGDVDSGFSMLTFVAIRR
jgi:hypothetical protein